MAFNNLGNFWLAPGQETRIALAMGGLIEGEPEWGGHDFGAQWIMADSMGIRAGALLVKDHTKEKKPLRGQPGNPAPIVYVVTVVNIGSEDANYSLQGGGNV